MKLQKILFGQKEEHPFMVFPVFHITAAPWVLVQHPPSSIPPTVLWACCFGSFIVILLSELIYSNISVVKTRTCLRKHSNLARQVYLVGKASVHIT